MRRFVPAIVLFVLSPLVAEYLLGDLTLTALGSLLFLAFRTRVRVRAGSVSG